jgi:mono/diheme cytochrome c family protein
MNRLAIGLCVLLAACSAPVAEQATTPAPAPAASAEPAHAHDHHHAAGSGVASASAGVPVEGRRVARRVGCFGCHGDDLAGKQLWGEKGRFQMWSANITEHRDHYSDADFERLLRTGQTHDGHRPLGMPILMYQHLSDREVRDIVALLRSVPAKANPGLKRTWMTAAERRKQEGYGDDRGDPVAVHAPPEPPTEKLALGKHLAMTSCPECHGGDLNGFEGEEAPSLIVAKGYSLEQFRKLIRTGLTASGKESKSGLMTDVARNRLAPTLTDAEIDALKAYLDSR